MTLASFVEETAGQLLARVWNEKFRSEIPEKYQNRMVRAVTAELTDSAKVTKLLTKEQRLKRAEALARWSRIVAGL